MLRAESSSRVVVFFVVFLAGCLLQHYGVEGAAKWNPPTASNSCCAQTISHTGIATAPSGIDSMANAMNLECQGWTTGFSSDVEYSNTSVTSTGIFPVVLMSWLVVEATGDGNVQWFSFQGPQFQVGFSQSFPGLSGDNLFIVDIDYGYGSGGTGFYPYITIYQNDSSVWPTTGFSYLADGDRNNAPDNAGFPNSYVIDYAETSTGSVHYVSNNATNSSGDWAAYLDSYDPLAKLPFNTYYNTFYVAVGSDPGRNLSSGATGPSPYGVPNGLTYRLSVSMSWHNYNTTAPSQYCPPTPVTTAAPPTTTTATGGGTTGDTGSSSSLISFNFLGWAVLGLKDLLGL